MRLESARLVLRPFESGDAPGVHAVWNEREFLRFAPVGFRFAGADLSRVADWCARGEVFAGVERSSGRLACHVGLFGADWSAMTVEIHYWTAVWARGNGFAVEAARLVAGWALSVLGFARVTLQTDVRNVGSRRVARGAGFRFEGVLRNASWTRSGRADLAVFSVIPGDVGQ
ncbi:putative N-acetyltransferase [Actinoplanes sp. SE50]|uniref:GNAT family N-acetyltransferase n=1 Tax=unclassified Actinoplanes TaxID=2626549 RepID=UPI00023EC114|nr:MULTISPECIES: GNAT family N-acetyltransferase [unclassified Actinoplanes]AEV85203.1 putative N-acetyltransferase [Actinoplanes sp. SE50/110]ATO83598.1 putative N-acetyltransferase [Actinoplanes sp. SE50]SLM01005.1 putative N-acetyltransferase [Actinoplanes sp. SE50/110]